MSSVFFPSKSQLFRHKSNTKVPAFLLLLLAQTSRDGLSTWPIKLDSTSRSRGKKPFIVSKRHLASRITVRVRFSAYSASHGVDCPARLFVAKLWLFGLLAALCSMKGRVRQFCWAAAAAMARPLRSNSLLCSARTSAAATIFRV